MHEFENLVFESTQFTLTSLKKVNDNALKALEVSAPTSAVVALKMIGIQKAIFATGMFSIFEASLQDTLQCEDGFEGAKKILEDKKLLDLHDRFNLYFLAINVLKHGKGASYNKLLEHVNLPFNMKKMGQNFFDEGDVSEIPTLILVDDQFVLDCAQLIEEVSESVKS